jgi:hypothetical protein
MKWEHAWEAVRYPADCSLDEYTEDGWELIQVLFAQGYDGGWYFFFKRPKQED